MIWKIATAGLACLAVSGWGFAWWWRQEWNRSARLESINRRQALQFERWLGLAENALDYKDSVESVLRKALESTGRRLRPFLGRCSPGAGFEYQEDEFPTPRDKRNVEELIEGWRADVTTGNWGRYLRRERGIRWCLRMGFSVGASMQETLESVQSAFEKAPKDGMAFGKCFDGEVRVS